MVPPCVDRRSETMRLKKTHNEVAALTLERIRSRGAVFAGPYKNNNVVGDMECDLKHGEESKKGPRR